MTDLQDMILDRLVGAKLGANLPDSPLRVAAELIEGERPIKFGQTFNDSAMAEIANRLGFPVILVEGVQGGIKALKDEEDRRRFAMTVFRVLPVGGTPPKLTTLEMAKVAALTAIDVHPLVCKKKRCKWPQQIAALADPPDGYDYSDAELHCQTAEAEFPNGLSGWLSPNSPNTARLLKLGEFVHAAFLNKPRTTAGYALRECVRLTITEQGISEAVAMVVGIAQRCGMAAESV